MALTVKLQYMKNRKSAYLIFASPYGKSLQAFDKKEQNIIIVKHCKLKQNKEKTAHLLRLISHSVQAKYFYCFPNILPFIFSNILPIKSISMNIKV